MKNHHNAQDAVSLHGFEKEGIRVTPDGTLSHMPHPAGFGSSLMHPYITTDFAEPQLEFRTASSESIDQALFQLKEIHIFTTRILDGEFIWPFSMPPQLPELEKDIPLAVYGNSPEGQKKTVYRRGIGLRYGRKKLTISGVHYNFSLSPRWLEHFFTKKSGESKTLSLSDCYFHVIRNLYRNIFYLTYLFGASPAFDKSFEPQDINRFKRHKSATWYCRYATSLRASEIGYTSKVQDQLPIDFNSPDAYIKTLGDAVDTCNPDYLKFSDNPLNQLNPNFLQAAYELYAPFRPKPLSIPGEKLPDALKKHGVGYLELRLPDLDPEYPIGVDPHTMGFLHLTMLKCLMQPSPPLFAKEIEEIKTAHRQVIWQGRKSGISIWSQEKNRPFHETGKRFCYELYKLAEKLDRNDGACFYQKSVSRQIEKWDDPGKTPSGRHLHDLLDNNKDFIESGMEIAENNSQFFKKCKSDANFQKEIEAKTLLSIELHHKLDADEKE